MGDISEDQPGNQMQMDYAERVFLPHNSNGLEDNKMEEFLRLFIFLITIVMWLSNQSVPSLTD
jgi:hypothetical protein